MPRSGGGDGIPGGAGADGTPMTGGGGGGGAMTSSAGAAGGNGAAGGTGTEGGGGGPGSEEGTDGGIGGGTGGGGGFVSGVLLEVPGIGCRKLPLFPAGGGCGFNFLLL